MQRKRQRSLDIFLQENYIILLKMPLKSKKDFFKLGKRL
jgi:hypothetical protein